MLKLSIIVGVLVALLLIFAPRADASIEFGVGTGATSKGIAEGSVMGATWIQETDEWSQDFTGMPWVIGVTIHQEYTYRDIEVDEHFKVTGSKRLFDWEFSNDWYLFGDFGVAWTNETSDANSSYFMFYEQVGIRYSNVSLGISHTSNAGLKEPNRGENTLLLSYRF